MKLYNSLTKCKESLKFKQNRFSMYICGLTVYDRMHLGHLFGRIVYDVLQRYLEHLGVNVISAINYTDIDDRIIDKAKDLDVEYWQVSKKNIESAEQDLKTMNIKVPTYSPRATEEIAEIIQLIRALLEKGYAYENEGNVFFKIAKFADYGKLSGNIQDYIKKNSGESDLGKLDEMDFALWKKSPLNENYFESPWGNGRPGWHIECSAMSVKYLGTKFDLHGGGLDLIFPHHENELAQSEAIWGTDNFVKLWMHNGLLTVKGGVKMSKSLGNSFFVSDAIERYGANGIRLWMLQSHYRSFTAIDTKFIDDGVKAYKSLERTINLENRNGSISEYLSENSFTSNFEECMNDDLNTPKAIGLLFEMAREINIAYQKGLNMVKIQNELKYLLSVLGFDLNIKIDTTKDESIIRQLIAERDLARANKNFEMADKIRDKLYSMGVSLNDTPSGTKWEQL